jgi:hypothetical protein
MGNLTDDMTRLRGEVDALRSDRGAQIKDRVATVSTLLSDFAAAHATMARKTGKARASYVARIKKQVGQMRKENASDIAGASHAWFAF